MKFQELIEKHKQIRAEVRKQGEEALHEMFAEFFLNFPEVKAIRWEQYTPYFNDGDPCHFSVCDPRIYLSDEPIDDDDRWDSNWKDLYTLRDEDAEEVELESKWGHKYKQKPFTPLGLGLEDLSNKMCSQEGEEIFEHVFGDHVLVTVKAEHVIRTIFDTAEFEHD